MSEDTHIHESATGLHTVSTPQCPQLRPTSAEWIYPVEGYCVLRRTPGQFMIPSIEEFRRYCTTPRFCQCPWFGRPEGDVRPFDPGEFRDLLLTDVWRPAGLP